MQQVVTVLKNGVDYNNLNQQINIITVSVDSTGTPVVNVQFQNNLTTKIQGMICISATNQSGVQRFPSAQPFIGFTQNGNTLIINHISGLPIPTGNTNSDTYALTILSIGANIPTS